MEVNGEQSEVVEMGGNGVIQGAPSSGDLFLIFLNNLPDAEKSTTEKITTLSKQFVDDINSVIMAKTNSELMKRTLQEYKRIERQLINHRMKINGEKTQLMCIKPDKDLRKEVMTIGSAEIKHQSTIKILGLTLSEDMKFNDHLCKGKKNMVKSLNAKCSMLRLLKPFIPTKQLSQVGGSLINSTILYAAPVWGATSLSNIQQIQSCQIKAARMITGYRKRGYQKEHRQTTLNQLNWPNTTQIVTSATLNLIKRATKGASSSGLNNMFRTNEPIHARNGRAQTITHKGPINRPRSDFSAFGVEIFNKLPNTIREKSLSCEQFKRELKLYSRTINLLQMH